MTLCLMSFLGCGHNSSSAAPPDPGSLKTIGAESQTWGEEYSLLLIISRITVSSNGKTTEYCGYEAEVKKGGTADPSAKIKVNGKSLSFLNSLESFTSQTYPYNELTPNSDFEVKVTINGVAVRETFSLPGDITISPDGSQVSWKYEGNADQIAVSRNDDNGLVTDDFTYTSKSAHSDLNSPSAIPGSAYPNTGKKYFTQMNSIKEYNDRFKSMTNLSTSTVRLIDGKAIEVQK